MVKLHGFAEPQLPPLKLVNVDPLLGTAITVTAVPGLYCMQFAPQEDPTGVIATLPLPLPLLAVERLTDGVAPAGGVLRLKVAVTVVGAAVIVKLHGFVEAQPPPLKPAKVDPLLGTAITVTVVPGLYCMQLAPQEAPDGAIAT